MSHERTPPLVTPEPERPTSATGEPLPPYDPPRVVKKRSVARATLLTGTGPIMGGLVATG